MRAWDETTIITLSFLFHISWQAKKLDDLRDFSIFAIDLHAQETNILYVVCDEH